MNHFRACFSMPTLDRRACPPAQYRAGATPRRQVSTNNLSIGRFPAVRVSGSEWRKHGNASFAAHLHASRSFANLSEPGGRTRFWLSAFLSARVHLLENPLACGPHDIGCLISRSVSPIHCLSYFRTAARRDRRAMQIHPDAHPLHHHKCADFEV